jgi:transposase
MEKTEIGKLFEFSLKVLEKARVPLYSCKFSKRTYTQRQHLALLVLKTFLRADYRKVCKIAEDLWASFAVLDLPRIPHFTTLQKFFARMGNTWLERLIESVLHQFSSIKYLAMDSTGLAAERVSQYYCMRVNKAIWNRNFLKLSLLIDVKRRLAVAACCHNRPRHDNRDVIPLLKKADRPASFFLADSAYDSISTFSTTQTRGMRPIIPLRGLRRNGNGVSDRLRVQMLNEWADDPAIEKHYHQRSLIESYFSALKRRLGEEVRSRLWWLQRREALLKVVVYSILNRARLLALAEDFYRAGPAHCL